MAIRIPVFDLSWSETDAGSQSSGSCATDVEEAIRDARFADLKEKVRKHKRKGRKKKKLETASIWRVPRHLRNLQAEAYEPKMVSIGPLHHGKAELRHMEKVKLQCLCYLLDMGPRGMLDFLMSRVEENLTAAKGYYSEKINFSDDELVEMLVLDGCFIVTIVYTSLHSVNHEILRYIRFLLGFSHLLMDLMLLENQIPFFVLNELNYHIYPGLDVNVDFLSTCLARLNIMLPRRQYPHEKDVLHFLHLLHLSTNSGNDNQQSSWRKPTFLSKTRFLRPFCQILCGNCSRGSDDVEKDENRSKIPTASELLELGVRLKAKRSYTQKQPLDLSVSFRDGTLEISSFLVSNSTNDLLKNMVAFEQCCRHSLRVTSNYIFLDHLINAADDVADLRKSKILKSELLSDVEIAEIFNGHSSKLLLHYRRSEESTHLDKIYKDVHDFCQVPHHRWWANLRRNYFGNPWTTLSVIAGFLLLLFTGTQTFLAVFPRK